MKRPYAAWFLFALAACAADEPEVDSDEGAVRTGDRTTDAVTEWNKAVAQFGPSGLEGSMAMNWLSAMTNAAMFDAINSVERKYAPFVTSITPAANANAEAAAVSAAHDVLVARVPERKAEIDALLGESLAKIPGSETAKGDGVTLGQKVAQAILSARAGDTIDTTATYTKSPAPGVWEPTPPALLPAIGVAWGTIKGFSGVSLDAYDFGAPPALDSAEYAADLNEVKAVGGKNSECRQSGQKGCRTPEQTKIAQLIGAVPANATGSADLVGKIIEQITAGRSLLQRARAFAMVRIAQGDARIKCWEAKYQHNFWRPITAIRKADTDSNPATEQDPSWESLLMTPAFPEFPSGHATITPAGIQVLIELFGDDQNFTLAVPSLPDYSKRYTKLSQLIDDSVDGRVWAGLHFRSSDVKSASVGTRIGADVAKKIMRSVTY